MTSIASLAKAARLTRRRDVEERLWDRMRAWLVQQERAPGIHASDLLMPRRGYWRMVAPVPLSDREVGLFLVGRVLHAFLLEQGALASDEGQLREEQLGLYYSPDRLSKDGRWVVEVKTHRGLREPTHSGEVETYVRQLLIYLACTRRQAGMLWVLYVNLRDDQGRTCPQVRCYELRLSERGVERAREALARDLASLRDAIRQGDPSALPLCPEWICSERLCPWWHRCQPEGRYPTVEGAVRAPRRGGDPPDPPVSTEGPLGGTPAGAAGVP